MASVAPVRSQILPVGAVITALTIASLFSGGIKVTLGFDLRLSYLFVILALGAILLLTERPVLPVKPFAVLVVWLVFSCLATLSVAPNLIIVATVPQVIGIGFFAGFFLIFFANARSDPVSLFEIYVQSAVVVALIGLPILIWTGLSEDFWRLRSIFAEPAHYATAMIPATAYALATARKAPSRAVILGGAMLLTVSLTGYIGIGLSLAFVVGRRWWTRLLLAIFGGLLLLAAYAASPEIRMRIDDTARVAATADLAGANLSTFALLSNLWVAWSAFTEQPMVGGGLGSHRFSHEKYIGNLTGLGVLEEYIDQNKQDANSLFARTLSEQGFIGIMLIFTFIWYFRTSYNPNHQVISSAILVYFILKLIRDGHYFTPEFFFMVVIFMMISNNYRLPDRLRQPGPE